MLQPIHLSVRPVAERALSRALVSVMSLCCDEAAASDLRRGVRREKGGKERQK